MSSISWSPVTAILENKSPGTVVIGRPGSGKTYFLLNVAANCLLTGCRVIYIDPKNDAAVLKDIYNDIKITDVNNISPGALNPFKILKDISSNVILSIISCICGDLSDNQLVSISPIVNDFVKQNNRDKKNISFSMLANYLYASSNEDAQTIGTMLKMNEDSKYGKLILSDSSNSESLKIGKTSSEVISLLGLPLPNSNTKNENLSAEEKFSSAIIYIICKMLREVLTEDNKIPTVLIIDEARIVFSNKALSGIVNDFLTLGRSLNIATVLASQNITHYPSGIEQLVSSKFMFSSSAKEAAEFLEAFDATDSNTGIDRSSIIEYIENIEEKINGKGGCFFIDSKNRGGFMRVKSNLGVTSNPLLKKRAEK